MPRPKNKEELLLASQTSFDALMSWIEELPGEERNREFPPGTMNRNIRDVLGHLYHWQLMMKSWHDIGQKGGKPPMPAEGYNWKTVPALNRKIHETYRTSSLNELKEWLNKTHMEMHKIMELYSHEELFKKKRYKWTGSTSLAAYLISATSSHYMWGLKLIKKQLAKK
ncbi:MAG: ClbS/DfsB family four-helix bundle protein [Bacteroidia bacterium]|nr:ClbS/DfsB family four-helix bundle protein [Bacteroidia bacterium]